MTIEITLILLVVGVYLCLLSIGNMKREIDRMNLTINKIANKVQVSDEISDEIKILIKEGKNVEAIKRYRIATGLGLAESKQYVDSLIELEQSKSN